MSVVAYSQCRIQFNANDRPGSSREYSERSVVELRQYYVGDYSVRAVDIENNREEIFNIPIKQANQYRRGRSANQPDEVPSRNGTYRLWLNEASRTGFHEMLDQIFAESANGRTSKENVDHHANGHQNNVVDRAALEETPVAQMISPNDLLLNTHQLSKHIKQGDENEADRLATQLALAGVRLQAKPPKNFSNETEFTINVQLNGNEYDVAQQGATIPLNVFPSTTVRELRAAFELSHQCVPSSQYFFANGFLLHDDQSMSELNVGPNSLFVLFLLTHAKTFAQNGPWKCARCTSDNPANNRRCVTCSASRTH